MRNRHNPVLDNQTANQTQHLSESMAPAPDIFLVISVRCRWPIAWLWQQRHLCELAKDFCCKQLGAQGPVFEVYGDVLPSPDNLLLVPCTKVVPHIIPTAVEFMRDCQKLWALNVQLQLGRYAIIDSSGMLLFIA